MQLALLAFLSISSYNAKKGNYETRNEIKGKLSYVPMYMYIIVTQQPIDVFLLSNL